MKHLHHPVVGDLELAYEAMELPADPGLTMFAYTAEPASPSEERLKLLASWAATDAAAAAAAAVASGDRTRRWGADPPQVVSDRDQRLGSVGGSPNDGSTWSSKRVIAQMRPPARVRTIRPTPRLAPVGVRR